MSNVSCEDLYREDSLKKLLRRFDIRVNSDRGQHFLLEKSLLELIARKAGPAEIGLEIGAGPGSLTCLLKKRFERIYAIEIDGGFQSLFTELNPEKSVEFVQADFLNLDFTELGLEKDRSAVLVGNIPYHITGKIFERAVESRDYFSRAVFTTQKEVADRILAEPGTRECGAITYYIRAYAEVSHLADLPPNLFYPPPEVDSSIIEIVFEPEKKFESDDRTFHSVVQGLFNYRRKTIRKGLIVSPKFSLTREEVDEMLALTGIDPRNRPEDLTIADFDRLTRAIMERI